MEPLSWQEWQAIFCKVFGFRAYTNEWGEEDFKNIRDPKTTLWSSEDMVFADMDSYSVIVFPETCASWWPNFTPDWTKFKMTDQDYRTLAAIDKMSSGQFTQLLEN